MSQDWQEKLRKLHDQLQKDIPTARPSSPNQTNGNGLIYKTSANGTTRSPSPAIDAILGIDFGTRFTKVAVSIPHLDQRKVLTLGSQSDRVTHSRIILGDNGRLYPVTCGSQTAPKLPIEYLKNRLANPGAGAFGASMAIEGVSLAKIIRPLGSFYLAHILRRAELAARSAFPVELGLERKINWFANVGVPTKHYDDSEMLQAFKQVSAVAWSWRSRDVISITPTELVEEYERAAKAINPEELPIQVAPELTAALSHFAEHRNTPAGVYSYFDIGGGTLDGSVFRLRREKEGPSIDILSANVEELGTMAVARNVVANAYKSMVADVEKPIIFGGVSPEAKFQMPKPIEGKIQTFFASVVADAVKKGLFPPSAQLPRRGLAEAAKPSMPVYIGGGGCRSEWYQHLFSRTCDEYGHSAQWGISAYDVKIVPPPRNIVDDDYPRFVIALGLTSENLHFNQYRLPSRYSAVPGPSGRNLSVPNYTDTKDLT